MKLQFGAAMLMVLALASGRLQAQYGPAGVGSSANNCLWLKADAGTSTTTSGAALSTWTDQSGNANDVTQATANKQPLFISSVMNGYPAIQFDNNSTTNDKLIGPDASELDNTSAYTFFTVSRPQTLDGEARVIVSKRTTVSVDQSFMLFYYTSNRFHTDIQSTNDRFPTTSTYAANNNYLIDVVYDGSLTAANRVKVYNGEALNVTSSETSASVPDNVSPLIIGSTDNTDGRPFGGYISEVIIYRAALPEAQRIIVNNYLSAKYNIALTANDKFAGDNAANGDYDRNVAGVGREASGSNTSFDPSASSGLGITAISGLDNGDYILAGHNVPVNYQQTTDVAGMTGTLFNARWSRVWYVDVTNTSTNMVVDFDFDLSDGDLGGSAGLTAGYTLLYRPGLTGSWTEIATASSSPGDRIKFNGLTLTADGYYTIGTRNYLLSPLPVELLSFEAESRKDDVLLSWSTASETESDYFTVEKSSDGETFRSVCDIEAAHFSTQVKEYECSDAEPYNGTSYYRLRQTDYDGTSTLSQVVAVNRNSTSKGECTVFPNPWKEGQLAMSYHGFSGGSLHIQLYNQLGSIVLETTAEIKTEGTIELPVTGTLKPGVYYLRGIQNEHSVNLRLVVQ